MSLAEKMSTEALVYIYRLTLHIGLCINADAFNFLVVVYDSSMFSRHTLLLLRPRAMEDRIEQDRMLGGLVSCAQRL